MSSRSIDTLGQASTRKPRPGRSNRSTNSEFTSIDAIPCVESREPLVASGRVAVEICEPASKVWECINRQESPCSRFLSLSYEYAASRVLISCDLCLHGHAGRTRCQIGLFRTSVAPANGHQRTVVHVSKTLATLWENQLRWYSD